MLLKSISSMGRFSVTPAEVTSMSRITRALPLSPLPVVRLVAKLARALLLVHRRCEVTARSKGAF